jgi:hypothetical protein
MEILHSEVIPVRLGTTPDYNQHNPTTAVLRLIESAPLAAGRENYPFEDLQFLFPIRSLTLYGPSARDSAILDPTQQDNKLDFQKQNVAAFQANDTQIIRGRILLGDWEGAFLRLSYRAGPDSVLAAAAAPESLGAFIQLWLNVGSHATHQLIRVPYHTESARYAVELWSWSGSAADLRAVLDARGRAALDQAEIIPAPALLPSNPAAFTREALDGQSVYQVAPDDVLHPIRPLHLELAWASADGKVWDSLEGHNHQYEFNMIVRGWDHYLSVGSSPNPHGGSGSLEYRNLLSNYGPYAALGELGREIPPWSFDAFGHKAPMDRREDFMTVNYMDSHILKPSSAIGLHRHRDNQEAFMVMGDQSGLMVVGDWAELPTRERCIEVRTLKSGHFALLKGGNLHALINPSDEDLFLFMFGGYD